MLLHHFRYAFKTLFRNKMLIFWTFAFPILLGTFFQMAFSDIEKNEQFDMIHIAVVDNEDFQKHEMIRYSLKELSDEKNDEHLFHIQYVDKEKAQSLLDNSDIIGYLTFQDDQPKVIVKKNGMSETIFQYVIEETAQTEFMMNDVVEHQMTEELQKNPLALQDIESLYMRLYQDALEMIRQNQTYVIDQSPKNLSYTMIEFYSLIAMTCLYGGILGMVSINQVLANMSSNGKRVSVSPVNKGCMILGSVLASYLIQLIGLLLLFMYTVFVLHVNYGEQIGRIVILACVGCLAGLSMGIAVGTLVKSHENMKTGIIISITMLGSFLSGMMGITMKYVIDTHFPIINQLNPVNMITDGLYALYYYDTFERYHLNVMSLLLFSCLMLGLSCLSLRRQTYDCI